jgi:Mg-chelatase subunit ChlD
MAKDWICPECKHVVKKEEIEQGLFDGVCPICGYCEKIIPKDLPPEGTVSKKQLGILVLDGSGSMSTPTRELYSKADAVSKSVTEFFEIIKSSGIKNQFCFAVIDFDEKAYRKLDITETANINTFDNYNPIHEKGKRTYLYTGLNEAEKIAEAFLDSEEEQVRSVVIVIMTDGLDMNMEKAKTTADRIKEKYGKKVKITASCFGTRDITAEDRVQIMAFLKTIVTEESFCIETSSAKELRSFFIASVSR